MRAWAALGTVAVLSACALPMFAPARAPWPALPDGHFMHVGEFLQVSGTGRPPESGSETQARSLARDSAILDAQARLVFYLNTLRLPDGALVGERTASDPAYADAVIGLARSAAVTESKFDSDDSVVVLLRLSKAKINEVFKTRYP